MNIEFSPLPLDVAKFKEASMDAIPTILVTPDMCTIGPRGEYLLTVDMDIVSLNGVTLKFGREWESIIVTTAGIMTIALNINHKTVDTEAEAYTEFKVSINAKDFFQVFTDNALKIGTVIYTTIMGVDVTPLFISQLYGTVAANRVGRMLDTFSTIGTGVMKPIDAIGGDLPPPGV